MAKGKKQGKNENRTLRNIFASLGIIIALIFLGYFAINSMNSFTYKGVDFKKVNFCDTKPCLMVYQTSLPITIGENRKAEYNFYLRNDPRILENVSFSGELKMVQTVVINSTGNLNCQGDGIIAVANLARLYEVLGAKVIKNETLGCDSSGKYMYLNIIESNETKIQQTYLTCYNIYVNNCEILESTERFMVETLSKVNGLLKEKADASSSSS